MDCYRAPGGCPRQGGDRKTPPQPSSSQSPGLSSEGEFQDLTPCWFKAGEGLTHYSITLTPGAAPGLAQRGSSGCGPRTTVTKQAFLSHLLCAQRGGDTELRATWSPFSRGTSRQSTAADTKGLHDTSR